MRVGIVGAGIIGLYLARKLAQESHQVTVFEKRKEIGKKECSGLFSERILEYIPESKKLIQNKIDYSLIHFPKKTLKVGFQKKFFVISHFELDRLMGSLAEEAGAEIVLDHLVRSLPKDFDRVVGCDGPNSIIRRSLILPSPHFCLGIQGFVSRKDSSDFFETWPTESGFIWKIPRGKEVEYGIMEELERAKSVLDEFLKNLCVYAHTTHFYSTLISRQLSKFSYTSLLNLDND